MVNQLSVIFMLVSLLLTVSVPVALIIFFYRKEKISFRSVMVGVIIFIAFSQVLEKVMHVYLLQMNTYTSTLLKNPVIFALYGGLAAGIFEEIGRFIGFKFLLKNNREWKDGIAYGIGHGGVESLLIGGLVSIQYISFSSMINAGVLEKTFEGSMTAEVISQLKNILVNSPSYLFILNGVERMFALVIQIALSVLVLYAVNTKKYKYVVAAILLHALFDVPAALYQAQVINIQVAEGIIAVFAAGALAFLIRSKRLFVRGSSL